MSSLRALALLAVPLSVLAGVAGACNSSSSASATQDGGAIDDASLGDAALGPLLCSLPVPATCPATAPCSFTAWGCPESACEGYFVVTDGTWTYYYSSIGGALAGEVPAADAAFVSCPYAFQPPASCTPVIASQCTLEGGAPRDGGSSPEAGGALDGSGAADGPDSSDDASASDGGIAADGAIAADGGSSSDSGTGADGS